ncbi:hypothetical protein FBU30_010825 [Linnemannia zychae]|nr:hypothetical protein FBU30_010825 [Linnemannia zychae]
MHCSIGASEDIEPPLNGLPHRIAHTKPIFNLHYNSEMKLSLVAIATLLSAVHAATEIRGYCHEQYRSGTADMYPYMKCFVTMNYLLDVVFEQRFSQGQIPMICNTENDLCIYRGLQPGWTQVKYQGQLLTYTDPTAQQLGTTANGGIKFVSSSFVVNFP